LDRSDTLRALVHEAALGGGRRDAFGADNDADDATGAGVTTDAGGATGADGADGADGASGARVTGGAKGADGWRSTLERLLPAVDDATRAKLTALAAAAAAPADGAARKPADGTTRKPADGAARKPAA
ncbi:MAG TPA: hypothetical protein VFS00_14030, partial [Polyangiaceae bacterium]|nr:hypothetical protein [Polyangiaceae bacterium]